MERSNFAPKFSFNFLFSVNQLTDTTGRAYLLSFQMDAKNSNGRLLTVAKNSNSRLTAIGRSRKGCHNAFQRILWTRLYQDVTSTSANFLYEKLTNLD